MTICLAPVANAGDLNGCAALRIEEYAVVAAAKTELSPRRLELLDVAYPAGQVSIQTVENLQRGRPINGSEIGPSIHRPDDSDPFGRSATHKLKWPIRTRAGSLLAECPRHAPAKH